jgi:AAHS family 4-hydroxybenzoate transporter-like MFS transporter
VLAGLATLVCAFSLCAVGRHGLPMMIGLGLLGLTGSAAQSAMFALGAHAFPLPLRARGMGLMGAAGRLGALVSAWPGRGWWPEGGLLPCWAG